MGKSSSQTIGYWYQVLYHAGLGVGPFDVFLEFRGGDKTAWQGELTSSGTISINAPYLWGGEKDQGGIVGDVDVMFGEATQMPNAYLLANLGSQVPAWRGMATLVFKGGRYGAMNPYPQKASYKIRKIKKGWDTDPCWYPEKAEIPLSLSGEFTTAGYFSIPSPTTGTIGLYQPQQIVPAMTGTPMEIAQAAVNARNAAYEANANEQRVWLTSAYYDVACGRMIAMGGANNHPPTEVLGVAAVAVSMICPVGYTASSPDAQSVLCTMPAPALIAMNPAHVLYYARTHSDIGREPTANINDASYQAAADTLHAEGFGICTAYDPQAESLEEFEQRICKLIGGSVSRSLVDGQWYLDLARGDYVLEDLPLLTDDDILDFNEQPSTLDGATNSLSVKYFDPERKEAIVTPPVQALALIDAFGTIHQANEYPEIPVAGLAARVADRDLRTTVTPTRAFELTTTRRPYAWRPNQYFRLQAPKRGIADMVCILGEKQSGTLRSGAIKLKATQDIYSLPSATFIEVEPGVDTGPSQTPLPIGLQAAFEAPYVDVAGALPRAELQALPADVGYLIAVAADPATSRDFALTVAPDGGDYEAIANGEWTPTATVVEAAEADATQTAFTLANGYRLDRVVVGSPVLWDGEIGRVDAIDAVAGTIAIGRGCADTVEAEHAAGSRLWFWSEGAALDTAEYTDGESIDIKLLTNTGSQQLDPALATRIDLTFDQRAARPYPPARVRVNGESSPEAITGLLTAEWAHRDRVLQADQLVDNEGASIGPEVGTTYTLRWYLDGVLEQTHTAVAGTSQTHTPAGEGLVRLEIESVRDGLTSWQAQVREFYYVATLTAFLETESGVLITLEDGTPISLE